MYQKGVGNQHTFEIGVRGSYSFHGHRPPSAVENMLLQPLSFSTAQLLQLICVIKQDGTVECNIILIMP